MKYLLLSLLIFGFGISGSMGQTIKSLGYNTTNSQVVWTNTNGITFPQRIRLTNQFESWFNASSRTNWGDEESKYAGRIRGMATNDGYAYGLLVGTPFYKGSNGIIFHAVSKATGSADDFFQSRFIVRSDGRVGVNINDPSHKFHVAGDSRFSGDLYIDTSHSIKDVSLTNEAFWGESGNYGPRAFLSDTKIKTLDVKENARFTGNITIGDVSWLGSQFNSTVTSTTNNVPFYAGRFASLQTVEARGLVVNLPNTTNSNSTILHLVSGSAEYDYDNQINPNSRFIVRADGKVGIGTESPTSALTIKGALSFDASATNAAAQTRTNLDLGGGITTNRAFVSYNVTNYTTNTVTISNGIITGWTQ